jgi:uncharacterized protein DUF2188
MKGGDMASGLVVVQDKSTGNWEVQEHGEAIETFIRMQDARAYARQKLLERGTGSVVVYTPSGRPRETLSVRISDGPSVVRAA